VRRVADLVRQRRGLVGGGHCRQGLGGDPPDVVGDGDVQRVDRGAVDGVQRRVQCTGRRGGVDQGAADVDHEVEWQHVGQLLLAEVDSERPHGRHGGVRGDGGASAVDLIDGKHLSRDCDVGVGRALAQVEAEVTDGEVTPLARRREKNGVVVTSV